MDLARATTTVEPRELFNWLNNFFPVVPVYLDTEVPPDPSQRLLRSVITTETQLAAKDVSYLPSTPFMLVLMVDDDWRAAHQDTIESFLGEVRRTCGPDRCLLAATTNHRLFLQLYGRCAGLFEVVDEAQKKRATFRQTVYPSDILEGRLFLGDFENGSRMDHLQPLGVTAVIDATNTQSSKDNATANDIRYLSVDVDDHPSSSIEEYFDPVVRLVKEELLEGNGVVLIHCRAGWSRSPTLLLVVLMELYHKTLHEGLSLVMKARPMVCPNPGFCDKLIAHEAALLQRQQQQDEQEESKALSFADRVAMMGLIGRMNVMWSPTVQTAETDLDRRAVRPQGPKEGEDMEEYLKAAGAFDETRGVTDEPKPKRAFLKRKR